ncbi:MAG: hypothetical protein NTV01_21950 [Bacteroidia bacterium]|nr:hypothetical protein [Bacteroidia bacterium]
MARKHNPIPIFTVSFGLLLLLASCQIKITLLNPVTVPFVLDHNRMLVDAEIQRNDSTWRKVRLWVDTGNPTFFISESLARDLGIDLSATEDTAFKSPGLQVATPGSIRIGGKRISLDGVKSRVVFQPFWLFSTMHNDANLPSSVLKKYSIVFDYPKKQFTIAEPGGSNHRGTPSPAAIQPETGIVQIDAMIDGDSLSFALDNGASYSFISEDKLLKYSALHPDWPRMTGTAGCSNMWGWWPANEQSFPVARIPEIKWGQTFLSQVGMVGVPKFSPDGPTLGEWYSGKTAHPVDGFLGPNALKAYRVEIDYKNSLVYFEKGQESVPNEMDMVGLSVRQLQDSAYQIVGIVKKDGKPAVDGIEQGDILIKINDLQTRGATMGTVVDALRGKPGETRILGLERNGQRIIVEAKVQRLL